MTEIILGLIVLSLLVYHAWYVRETNKKQKEMIKAIMSKNLQEYEASEIIEKATNEEVKPPDEQPMGELDQKDFDKFIDKQVNG